MKNIENMNNFRQKNVLVCDGGGNTIWGEERNTICRTAMGGSCGDADEKEQ